MECTRGNEGEGSEWLAPLIFSFFAPPRLSPPPPPPALILSLSLAASAHFRRSRLAGTTTNRREAKRVASREAEGGEKRRPGVGVKGRDLGRVGCAGLSPARIADVALRGSRLVAPGEEG